MRLYRLVSGLLLPGIATGLRPAAHLSVSEQPTQDRVGKSIALFLQIDNVAQWGLLAECLGNVVGATQSGRIHTPLGLVSVIFSHDLAAGSVDKGQIERTIRMMVHDEGTVHLAMVPEDSGMEMVFLKQLANFFPDVDAGENAPAVLVMRTLPDETQVRRSVQSLCGTVPQVISAVHRLEAAEGAAELIAPHGSIVDSSTPTTAISPHLARMRLAGEATCAGLLGGERFERFRSSCSRLEPGAFGSISATRAVLSGGDVAPINARVGAFVSTNSSLEAQTAVGVLSGGMFWMRGRAMLADSLLRCAESVPPTDVGDVLEIWLPSVVHSAGGRLEALPQAPKVMAIYFPQFHRIPENDIFWGKGFTEWTLLKPLSLPDLRHPLPVEEGGLGYYDATELETRRRQGELAKQHGIYGFVFYHYWFNSAPEVKDSRPVKRGKRDRKRSKKNIQKDVAPHHKVMYKIPELILQDGEPNIPFMLSWANEPWSRRWDGSNSALLIGQAYGNESEWAEHFDYLLQFFRHPKYVRVEGKPAFAIYRPGHLRAKLQPMLSLWHQRALQAGLPGLHIIATANCFDQIPDLDEAKYNNIPEISAAFHFLSHPTCCDFPPGSWKPDRTWRYPSTGSDSTRVNQRLQYWGAFTGFDRRPRNHHGGSPPWNDMLRPEEFGMAVNFSFSRMAEQPARDVPENLYFVAAWNEWNEQNTMEPDDVYRFGYLEEMRKALEGMPSQELRGRRPDSSPRV